MRAIDFSNIVTPSEYREASFLAREAAKEMFNRLKMMKLNPKQIVDLGCGLGAEVDELALSYPEAEVYGIDVAQTFLQEAKKQEKKNVSWVLADSNSLPLRSHSVDLIFANLLLPWVMEPAVLLREWRRILRPKGLLIFSCLGPDTFKEWKAVTAANFLPRLVDMHHTGDALLEEGFLDPVLEVEEITLTYRSERQRFIELAKSGMQPEGTEGAALAAADGLYPVTFEVVYGHAWCPPVKGFKSDEQGVVRIPVSELSQSARRLTEEDFD